jgi:hypothetical protein
MTRSATRRRRRRTFARVGARREVTRRKRRQPNRRGRHSRARGDDARRDVDLARTETRSCDRLARV